MPTYEFRCPNGHDFERFYKTISAGVAAVQVECPECGAVAGRRMSAGAGLLFKGSGFYLTDYGKNAHRAPGGSKPAAGGDAAPMAESRPDAGKREGGGAEPAQPAQPAQPAKPAKPAADGGAPASPPKKADSPKSKSE